MSIDMWPSHAHILKPLTDQAGLKKHVPIQWTNEMQHAFDKMRVLMAANDLVAYPDHNERFDVYVWTQSGTVPVPELGL